MIKLLIALISATWAISSLSATLEIASVQNTFSQYTFPTDTNYKYYAKVAQGSATTDIPCTINGVDDADIRNSIFLSAVPQQAAGSSANIRCMPSTNYAGKNYALAHIYYQCPLSATYFNDCIPLYIQRFTLGAQTHFTAEYTPYIDLTEGVGTLITNISASDQSLSPVIHLSFPGKICQEDKTTCVPVTVKQNGTPVPSDIAGDYKLTALSTLETDFTDAAPGYYSSTGTITLSVQ